MEINKNIVENIEEEELDTEKDEPLKGKGVLLMD